MENKVLESTRFLVEHPIYVNINDEKLEETAKRFADERFKIPDWRLPVYPEADDEKTIDFFMVMNAINFAFTDFETGKKYAVEHDGEWKGAFGKTMALKRALEEGIDICDGKVLKHLQRADAEHIFRGNIEIPMLDERVAILNEVGEVLCDRYDGRFHNLVASVDGKLYNNGQGLVERLTSEFPSFNDSTVHAGAWEVRFDKRAQLAAALMYGRFISAGVELFEDVDKLTVFADYQLPRSLRGMGVMEYDRKLAEAVDNNELLQANSLPELEIRAATVHAADRLIKKINELRGPDDQINALHMDYRLWKEGRSIKGQPHHLCKTIAY